MRVDEKDLSQIKDSEDLQRFTSIVVKDLVTVINGKVSFTDNIDAKISSVTFAGAGSEVSVSHGLGRVPNGYIVAKNSSGITVFDGGTANSATTLFVQATGGGVVSLIVF